MDKNFWQKHHGLQEEKEELFDKHSRFLSQDSTRFLP